MNAGTVTPSTGSGTSQLFSATFTNSRGVSDISYTYLKVATSAAGPTNTCMVRYDRAHGQLTLRDDAGVWQTLRRFSQGGTQTNSQCTVNFSSSSASSIGQTLTLNVSITFKAAHSGSKNLYLYAESADGSYTDWQQRGTWTIP